MTFREAFSKQPASHNLPNKMNAERLSKKTSKTYIPPMLTPLQDAVPESGSQNVPETNNGLLS